MQARSDSIRNCQPDDPGQACPQDSVTLHAGRPLALPVLARLIDRPDRQPAAASAAGGLVQPGHGEPPHHFTGAAASQTARLSSRCIRSGVWSPARSASVQPFRRGRSLISAAVYLPACSHTSTRAKHGRSNSSSS
jgi:hypothetical protein